VTGRTLEVEWRSKLANDKLHGTQNRRAPLHRWWRGKQREEMSHGHGRFLEGDWRSRSVIGTIRAGHLFIVVWPVAVAIN